MSYDWHITVYLKAWFFAKRVSYFDICHFPCEIAQILVFLQVNIVCKQMRTATLRHSAQYKCALRMSCYAGHVPLSTRGAHNYVILVRLKKEGHVLGHAGNTR